MIVSIIVLFSHKKTQELHLYFLKKYLFEQDKKNLRVILSMDAYKKCMFIESINENGNIEFKSKKGINEPLTRVKPDPPLLGFEQVLDKFI